MRHVSLGPEISIAGLLTPDAILRGKHLCGFKVLNDPSALLVLLASGEINLVLLADADSASVADAVESTTQVGVELRLLPAATEIIRGEASIGRCKTGAGNYLARAWNQPDLLRKSLTGSADGQLSLPARAAPSVQNSVARWRSCLFHQSCGTAPAKTF